MSQHEEILFRQSECFEYYDDYEYEPCDAPSECVAADSCKSGFDLTYSPCPNFTPFLCVLVYFAFYYQVTPPIRKVLRIDNPITIVIYYG